MKRLFFLVFTLCTIISCTKIEDEDVNREVALNIAKAIQAAINENVPSNQIGDINISKNWKGGTIEINGTFATQGVGDFTIN